MTKRRIFALITVIFVTLMTGCGTTVSSENPGAGPIEQEYIELPFKNVAVEDTSSAVQKWVENNKSTEQRKVFN